MLENCVFSNNFIPSTFISWDAYVRCMFPHQLQHLQLLHMFSSFLPGDVFLGDLLRLRITNVGRSPQAPSKLSNGFLLDIISAIPSAQDVSDP